MYTKKIIGSIVFLLAIMIGFSVVTNRSLHSSSTRLENHILQVEAATKSENWDKAHENLSSIQTDWEKTEKTWAILLDHIEIDNIDISLTKFSQFVKEKDKSQALAEAAVLKQYVKHIPEKESLLFKNLF